MQTRRNDFAKPVQPHSAGIAWKPTCEFGKYTRGRPQLLISQYEENLLRTGNSDIEKIRLAKYKDRRLRLTLHGSSRASSVEGINAH